MNNKYDTYGRLNTEPWPEINKGDRVGYITTVVSGRKKAKRQLFGYWDGEKVVFYYRNLTVRTKRWLTNENVF